MTNVYKKKPTIVDETKLAHHFVESADGLKWHYVEMGKGEPLVLLHGIPESWYCWRYQIEALAEHFHVIVPDMKGYGQSDKRDGDYSVMNVGRETVGFLDAIGVDKFNLVGHDWGGGPGMAMAVQFPDRVIKYANMSTPTLRYDPELAPHHTAFLKDPTHAEEVISDARNYVKWWFDTGGHKGGVDMLSPEEWDYMTDELARPGVAKAISRYFRDAGKNFTFEKSGPGENALSEFMSKLTVPTRFIYPDNDPRQPIKYVCSDLQDWVPGFSGYVLILGSGHFSMQEQPAQVNAALLEWFCD